MLQKRAVLVCLDGCSPEYLVRSSVPNIVRLGKEGVLSVLGQAMVPTVTNVNNVSLITGSYPREHGISSNCYYDRLKGEEVYMESSSSIMAVTIFEELSRRGLSCGLFSVKDKLCTLLNKGPRVVFSAENPPEWIVKEAGTPPGIYSVEVNPWLIKASRIALNKFDLDFVYVATTDYVGHKYAPGEEEAQRHMALIDDEVGQLTELLGGNLLCVTADHGMLDKTRAVNLKAVLNLVGIDSWVIPTVKDRYVVHHSNLSGSAYVYLINKAPSQDVFELLENVEGVERVLTADEAASEYKLPRDRLGDYLVLGEEDTVFGEASEENVCEVKIRSHGSLHERTIPIMVHGDQLEVKDLNENKDLVKVVLKYLLEN